MQPSAKPRWWNSQAESLHQTQCDSQCSQLLVTRLLPVDMSFDSARSIDLAASSRRLFSRNLSTPSFKN